jgi:hypothetical protein
MYHIPKADMQQIVINVCHGGFGLSKTATLLYQELSGKPIPEYHWELHRNDPTLVQVVKQLGSEANGRYAKLKIVQVPKYIKWHIAEYDGWEHVAEDHRTWE